MTHKTILRLAFMALIIVGSLLSGCATDNISSQEHSKFGSLQSQCETGNSEACFEAGKILNKNYSKAEAQRAIAILTRGAKFNTPQAKSDKYAASCVTELITAYDHLAYALVDENRVGEGLAYIKKSKQLWIYLHNLGYYGDNTSLKWYLDQEDEAFADVCQRARRMQAISAAGNAAMIQQATAGFAAGLQQGRPAVINPGVSQANSSGNHSSVSGNHSSVSGNASQSSNTIHQITHYPNKNNVGPNQGCPGQSCRWACKSVMGRATAPADICQGAYKGACTCQ